MTDTDEQFTEDGRPQGYLEVPIGEMPNINDPITSIQITEPSGMVILGYGPESEVEQVNVFSEQYGVFVQSRNSGQVLKPWYSRVAKPDTAGFYIKDRGTEGKHLHVDVDCHENGLSDRGLGRILQEHEQDIKRVLEITRKKIEAHNPQ
jgi:hypothetical protein